MRRKWNLGHIWRVISVKEERIRRAVDKFLGMEGEREEVEETLIFP